MPATKFNRFRWQLLDSIQYELVFCAWKCSLYKRTCIILFVFNLRKREGGRGERGDTWVLNFQLSTGVCLLSLTEAFTEHSPVQSIQDNQIYIEFHCGDNNVVFNSKIPKNPLMTSRQHRVVRTPFCFGPFFLFVCVNDSFMAIYATVAHRQINKKRS